MKIPATSLCKCTQLLCANPFMQQGGAVTMRRCSTTSKPRINARLMFFLSILCRYGNRYDWVREILHRDTGRGTIQSSKVWEEVHLINGVRFSAGQVWEEVHRVWGEVEHARQQITSNTRPQQKRVVISKLWTVLRLMRSVIISCLPGAHKFAIFNDLKRDPGCRTKNRGILLVHLSTSWCKNGGNVRMYPPAGRITRKNASLRHCKEVHRVFEHLFIEQETRVGYTGYSHQTRVHILYRTRVHSLLVP